MSIKIDCDSHFSPHDAFDEVDPKFAGRGPRIVYDGSGRAPGSVRRAYAIAKSRRTRHDPASVTTA